MPSPLLRVTRVPCKTHRINRWARTKLEHVASQLTGCVYPGVEQLCDWLARNHDGRFAVHHMHSPPPGARTHAIKLLPLVPDVTAVELRGRTLREVLLRAACWTHVNKPHDPRQAATRSDA